MDKSLCVPSDIRHALGGLTRIFTSGVPFFRGNANGSSNTRPFEHDGLAIDGTAIRKDAKCLTKCERLQTNPSNETS